MTLIVGHLRQQGILSKISERVCFARRRFGHYEVIDFLAVLFGYAISGERTLEAFYQRLQPFAVPFMALFERDRLPSRSALSRFVAALTEVPVEALRTLFLADLLSRPLTNEKQTGGLVDRTGGEWVVVDLDGTREAARQRVLPKTENLPPPFRRLDDVCAPGYTGRKRGEIVRTRTVLSQAHSYHWLGSFGNRGNGRYRMELRQALTAITRYLTAHHLPPARALLRLDGPYGSGAVLADVADFAFVTRGKDDTVLDHPLVQARLHLPPDQIQQRPESQMGRSLYDCPEVPVGSEGVLCRVVVATHPAGNKKSPVGVTRSGVVYELFFTALQHFSSFLAREAPQAGIADLDRTLILRYLSCLREQQLASVTGRYYLGSLRAFLETCAHRLQIPGLTRELLIFDDDFPPRREGGTREIPAEVLVQLRAHLKAWPTTLLRMVALLLSVGLRVNELCQLPVNCLITDDKHEWYLRFYQSKTRREQVIPLVEEEVIGAIQVQQQEIRARWGEACPYLFPSPSSPPSRICRRPFVNHSMSGR